MMTIVTLIVVFCFSCPDDISCFANIPLPTYVHVQNLLFWVNHRTNADVYIPRTIIKCNILFKKYWRFHTCTKATVSVLLFYLLVKQVQRVRVHMATLRYKGLATHIGNVAQLYN